MDAAIGQSGHQLKRKTKKVHSCREGKRENQMDMLHGTLWDKILLFALPLAASSMLQQLFNSADVAVVGRFAGSSAQAAVGSNSSLINLCINLFVGLSVGANAVIATYIGQKDEKRVKEAVHTTVALSVCSGIFLAVFGSLIARMALVWMDTPANVLDQAVLYLRIYFLGMPFIMFYNFGAAILRSKGDSKRPLYCLLTSGILNVILNMILVVAFRLGVAGVGIATVVSNAVSAAFVLYFLRKEEFPFRLEFRQIRLFRKPLKKILRIGVPAGIQGMVFSLSNVCIQSAINGFGSVTMAGSTDAWYFESFTYFIITAFAQTTVTFTSQNYGAGNYDRCRKIFRQCMAASIVFSGILVSIFILGRHQFIRLYTLDEAVIAVAMARMMHVVIVEWLPSTYEISASALRGMGCSALPAVITILGTCGFRLLWLYTVFARFPEFNMLMSVYPVSWILTGAIMLAAYFRFSRRNCLQFS